MGRAIQELMELAELKLGDLYKRGDGDGSQGNAARALISEGNQVLQLLEKPESDRKQIHEKISRIVALAAVAGLFDV